LLEQFQPIPFKPRPPPGQNSDGRGTGQRRGGWRFDFGTGERSIETYGVDKSKMAVVTSAAIILATISTVTVADHLKHGLPRQTGRMKLPTGNIIPMIRKDMGYGIILASDGSLWSWGEDRLGWPVLG